MNTNIIMKIGMTLAVIVFATSLSSCVSVPPRGTMQGGAVAYGGGGMAPGGPGYRHQAQRQGGQGFGSMTPGAQIDGPMDRTSLDNPNKYFAGSSYATDSDGLLTKEVCLGICRGTSIGWDSERNGFRSETSDEIMNVDLITRSMAKHGIVPNSPPPGSKRPDLGAMVLSKMRSSEGSAQPPQTSPYL